MDADIRWLYHYLEGASELDLNVSYHGLGSLFHPKFGTLVGDLTDEVRAHYDCAFASIGTSGTTISNKLMVQSALYDGDPAIIYRGCHGSILGSLIELNIKPHYIPVKLDPDYAIPLPPSAEDLRRALVECQGARAYIETEPNYFGRRGQVAEKAALCREWGAYYLADAAHGAHLRASNQLPRAIEDNRPHMITHSIHKTLGAQGQASLLLGFAPELEARMYEVMNTSPTNSTSFSVPILLSVILALAELRQANAWRQAVELAYELRSRLELVPGCRVVQIASHPPINAQDPTRVVVDIAETGISGYRFARLLAAANAPERHIAEMETQCQIVFIITSATTSDAVDRLVRAFHRIVAEHGRLGQAIGTLAQPETLPSVELTPRQAYMTRPRQRRKVPVAQAIGCVSAETIATYPPGAPTIVAGECFRREDIEFLQAAQRSGATLKGASSPRFEMVAIIDS